MVRSRRRSRRTTRSPRTHWARSLSGVQIRTRSTAGRVRPASGGRGQGVVRLELDHRPDDEPERLHRPFGERELGQQFGGTPASVL